MTELGPPPAPKPVKMPEMTAEDKKRLGGGGGGGPPMMVSPMPMMGSPMPMMMNGYPSAGGMGPNLVLNFNQPYGGMAPMYAVAVDAGGKKEEKKEEKKEPKVCPPIQVQGDPTWCQPRMVVKKGAKLKDDPCVIM